MCLNETKVQEGEIDSVLKHFNDYFKYSQFKCCPVRKNYSGVAILHNSDTAKEVELAMPEDEEGRVTACEFDDFVLVSCYTPHSGVGELKRLDYRVETWDRAFSKYIQQLKTSYRKDVVICGDLNVIRHNSDIYNPKWVKEGRPGLTDRERDSFELLLEECDLNDSFRKLYPLRQLVYSHWTDRCGVARKNNWGSRMDYFLSSSSLGIVDCKYHAQIEGSDHCPVSLSLKPKQA